jgi:hypothetical protein
MRRIPLTQRAPTMAHATIQGTAAGHRPTTGQLPQASESWRGCGPQTAGSPSAGCPGPHNRNASEPAHSLESRPSPISRARRSAATVSTDIIEPACRRRLRSANVTSHGAQRCMLHVSRWRRREVDAAQALCCSSRGAVAMEMIQSRAWPGRARAAWLRSALGAREQCRGLPSWERPCNLE